MLHYARNDSSHFWCSSEGTAAASLRFPLPLVSSLISVSSSTSWPPPFLLVSVGASSDQIDIGWWYDIHVGAHYRTGFDGWNLASANQLQWWKMSRQITLWHIAGSEWAPWQHRLRTITSVHHACNTSIGKSYSHHIHALAPKSAHVVGQTTPQHPSTEHTFQSTEHNFQVWETKLILKIKGEHVQRQDR